MLKASQTQKRTKFLEEISNIMAGHELFCQSVSRKNDTENQIQKALFLRLQMKLPNIIMNHFGYSKDKANEIIENHFVWEQKLKSTVSNFTFFATHHRPDSVLTIDKIRIGIEIKKGNNGSSIRAGIGQAIVYSTQFDFVVYFYIDTSPSLDIKSSYSGEKEKELINSLWKNYNIKFEVV